jgi:hypothetical protein
MKINNLLLLVMISLFLIGCGPSSFVTNSHRINNGDSKTKVVEIMGDPEDRQFEGDNEAWQWCSTDYGGLSGDDFVCVFFYKNNVTGIKTYRSKAYGTCEGSFRTVNWQRAADRIYEFREE